jgi:aspartate carbamoyltransferase catalytic subunit
MVFILFVIELKLKYAPILFEIAENSTRLVQSFVMAAIVFGIQRMLLKSSNSPEIQNDFRILKTIQGIYLIMLIMMTLVAAYN